MAFSKKRERELLERLQRKPSQAKRKVNTRLSRQYFMIICEGERTEPNYFLSFRKRLPKEELGIDAMGTGCNTIQVVEEAVKYRSLKAPNGQPYDQIWAVFDKDAFSDANFNSAIELAANNNIKCAYSNQAFELWYLLHFDLHEHAAHRWQYLDQLTARLGRRYQKNDDAIYELLIEKGNQALAIRRAKSLHQQAQGSGATPASSNPCTTVYLLVEELNKFIEKK